MSVRGYGVLRHEYHNVAIRQMINRPLAGPSVVELSPVNSDHFKSCRFGISACLVR